MQFIDLKQFYKTLANVLLEDGKTLIINDTEFFSSRNISLEGMVKNTDFLILKLTSNRYTYYKFLHLMGYDNAEFIKVVVQICGVDRISDLNKIIGKDIRKDLKKYKNRESSYDLYKSELGDYGISKMDLLTEYIGAINNIKERDKRIIFTPYIKENPHVVVSVVYNDYECFKYLCESLGTSPPETIKLTTSLLGVTSRTMSNKVKKRIKNAKENGSS